MAELGQFVLCMCEEEGAFFMVCGLHINDDHDDRAEHDKLADTLEDHVVFEQSVWTKEKAERSHPRRRPLHRFR